MIYIALLFRFLHGMVQLLK